jgi:cell division protein ZapA (FtsZ GTPase activity inhibitor)
MPAGAVITPAANPPPQAPAPAAPQRLPPAAPISSSSPHHQRASSAAEADAGQPAFQQQVAGPPELELRVGAACLLPPLRLSRIAGVGGQHQLARCTGMLLLSTRPAPLALQVLAELDGLKQQMRAMAALNQGLAGRVRQLEEVVAQQRQALERMQQKQQQQTSGGGAAPGWTDGAPRRASPGLVHLPAPPACPALPCSNQAGSSGHCSRTAAA